MLDALRDAVIMTVLVIFLFLADLRGMTLAAISIPFTYLLTFAVMWLIGYEFNMVTLTAVIRITSYNVCYTKLLRAPRVPRPRSCSTRSWSSSSRRGRPTSSVITSYSIHYTKLYELGPEAKPARVSWSRRCSMLSGCVRI